MVANKGYILWIHEKTTEWEFKNEQRESGLKDYKFFCFNGVARCFKVDFDRFIEHHANYYDMEKNLLSFGEMTCPPVFDKEIVIPENYEKMVELAEMLSQSTPFLRADFYDIDGKIYFGEMTFFPASGLGSFNSEEADIIMGKWLKLPESCGGGTAM